MIGTQVINDYNNNKTFSLGYNGESLTYAMN